MNDLEARVDAVEKKIQNIEPSLVEIGSSSRHLVKSVDEIKDALKGFSDWRDGDNNLPGVKLRLDRIEQIQKVQIWIGVVIIGTALTAGTATLLWVLARAMAAKEMSGG